MNRSVEREFLTYIIDANGKYCGSSYNYYGNAVVSLSEDKIPLQYNPSNLKNEMQLSFATNKEYFSGVRSLLIDFIFIEDGADIVRSYKYTGKGYADTLFFLVERYNSETGLYQKYYYGQLDLAKCKDNKSGISVPCLDKSMWGVLSQNDDVKYSIDCNPQNPKCIPILYDGINLRSRFVFNPPEVEFTIQGRDSGADLFLSVFSFPMTLIATEGDSYGLITQSQDFLVKQYDVTSTSKTEEEVIADFVETYNNSSFVKTTRDTVVRMTGNYSYDFRFGGGGDGITKINIYFVNKSGEIVRVLYHELEMNVATGGDGFAHMVLDINFDTILTSILIPEGDQLSLIGVINNKEDGGGLGGTIDGRDRKIFPRLSTQTLSINTQADSSIVYGIRPLDLLKEIIGRATGNKYKVDSEYFTINNKVVATCGDALRSVASAKIKTSFRDWFKSYDTETWLAFRIIQDQMWVEPAEVVYSDTTNIMELGEAIEYEIEDAYDYLINEIELNMNKQDYNRSSGRLEFNGLNTFSVHQQNIKNKLSLISPYRKDCYGQEFIRLDYQQQSTVDNSGDENVFLVEITDDLEVGTENVSNFVIVEVDNQPLAPIIYYPRNNDIIYNNHAKLTGYMQPDTSCNIYCDGEFQGVANSDSSGFFSFTVLKDLSVFEDGVNSGVHVLEATFTDLTGTVSSTTVTLMPGDQPKAIENIRDGQVTFDQNPVFHVLLPVGEIDDVIIDGVGYSVQGDDNGRFDLTTPTLYAGEHTIEFNSVVYNITVIEASDIPIINSFKDGFTIQNNLPLLNGSAQPNQEFNLYLDYYEAVPLGTVTADAFGRWSFQVVPVYKADGVSVLAPIPNGNHSISTDKNIKTCAISVNGYKLNRPAYTSISNVVDNTVFNTRLTPKHNMLNRMRYWKSIFAQQPETIIKFETGDKNPGFATTLDGVTIAENTNINLWEYEDLPVFYPLIMNVKVETPTFFSDIIDDFRSGGLVKVLINGVEVYCLPIGKMTVNDVSKDIQDWSLLVSSKTPLLSLLNLSNPGVILNTMPGTLFRTDLNTLHMVKYNFDASIDYDKQPELYEDWFANRNDRWVNNPTYIQKVQRTDPIIDQIITNHVNATITLRMFDCATGIKVKTFTYQPVTPNPLQYGDVLKQCTVDFSGLPDGEYVFTTNIGGKPYLISEPILLRASHPGTILVDSASKRNKLGAIFSAGWRSRIRVEGLVEKLVAKIDSIISEDEVGNFDNLNSIVTRKRTIIFGRATGIPDWLYLKLCSSIALDDLYIQGVGYTISKDASLEPVDKIPGYPMYYYTVDFDLRINQTGNGFDASYINGVIIIDDSETLLDPNDSADAILTN